MKIISFLSYILFVVSVYSYTLENKWLIPDTVQISQTSSLFNHVFTGTRDSLANFDFASCVNAMNSSVAGSPFLIPGDTTNTSNCVVDYAYLSDFDTYAICASAEPGEFSEFTITINNTTRYPFATITPCDTVVDINTTLRHEIGHALGIFHSLFSSSLMYEKPAFDPWTNPILFIANDEINALRNVYDVPSLQILNSHTFDGDTLKVFYENETDLVEFQVTTPNMLEFNSVTPPDLIPKGYFIKMDNSNSGLVVNLQAQGNDIYTYQISVESLTGYVGSNTMKFRSFIERSGWDYVDYRLNYSPCCENILKFVPKPTNESPLPGNQYYTQPSGGKESITDTLAIKVRVPQILGAYPAINIKIDDIYVNQGDITYDSEENVWIYYWDLSTVSPTEFGKLYTITSEIDGDPISNDVTGIYLVEALLYENFETITSLTAEGWYVESYESPPQTYTGWIIANHPVAGIDNQCAVGQSTASTSFYYWLFTPAINVPVNSNGETKLEYKMNFSMIDPPVTHSYIKFYVCDENRVRLTAPLILYPVNGQWTDFEYDLTPFAGQTIKLQWWHYYASATPCGNTFYYIDDVLVYTTPDMSDPAIDFIAGNSAEIDADMNLNIGFNDNSGIGSVTADYSIEGDSNSIVLTPVKGSYNYTGTIPARDHMCEGSITFKIKDSVGNETVSSGHSISWGVGGVLSAPENVVIAQPTSTTISVTWDLVDGATSYKVFSSTDPYGTFSEDSTGTFTESRKWEKTIGDNKYFYYVVATNALKKDEYNFSLKIGHRVK